jgi:tellurite resistance protein TehA-like permease
MMAMLAGIFLFAASFFFISIACDYRYLYGIDLAAMVTLFYLALDPASVWNTLRMKKADR